MNASVAFFWAVATSVSPQATESKIDAALNAALELDRTAYYQICGSPSKLRKFEALQARAGKLNNQFVLKFSGPNMISNRYVDRRAVGHCMKPKAFSKTISQWSAALDHVEIMLEQ